MLGLVLNYGKKQRKLHRNRNLSIKDSKNSSLKRDGGDGVDVKNNKKENPDKWIGFTNNQFAT